MLFVSDLPKKEKLEIYKMVKGCCLLEGYELVGSMRNMLDEKVKDVKDLLENGMIGYEPVNYMEVYKDYSYGRYLKNLQGGGTPSH